MKKQFVIRTTVPDFSVSISEHNFYKFISSVSYNYHIEEHLEEYSENDKTFYVRCYDAYDCIGTSLGTVAYIHEDCEVDNE